MRKRLKRISFEILQKVLAVIGRNKDYTVCCNVEESEEQGYFTLSAFKAQASKTPAASAKETHTDRLSWIVQLVIST